MEKRIMDTKAYCNKTAAFAGYLIQNVPSLTDAEMNHWMNNPAAIMKFMAGLGGPHAEPKPWLSFISSTSLDAVAGKPTQECFIGEEQRRYCHTDFDKWLPSEQPAAAPCSISTIMFSKKWTFAEAAAKLVGRGARTKIKVLGQALIAGGHTMSLPQGEKMFIKIESGANTKMRFERDVACFFVETGNEDNPVSVACVGRIGCWWIASVHPLESGYHWSADNRLLVRNLDTLKL